MCHLVAVLWLGQWFPPYFSFERLWCANKSDYACPAWKWVQEFIHNFMRSLFWVSCMICPIFSGFPGFFLLGPLARKHGPSFCSAMLFLQLYLQMMPDVRSCSKHLRPQRLWLEGVTPFLQSFRCLPVHCCCHHHICYLCFHRIIGGWGKRELEKKRFSSLSLTLRGSFFHFSE